jgi:hypothetical protein
LSLGRWKKRSRGCPGLTAADCSAGRIAEAEREGWLGEVEGLRISLAGANDKLAQIDSRLQRRASITHLGLPTFPPTADRASSELPE